MKKNQTMTIIAVLSVGLLSACVATPPDQVDSHYPQPPASTAPAYYASYGVIDSIQVVQQTTGNNGAGAVVGGVVGGVVGNQIGNGNGRTAATAAGVVGGAIVGNQIQNNNRQVREVYQVNVRLDNGNYVAVIQDNVTNLRVGDRARIENNRVFRY